MDSENREKFRSTVQNKLIMIQKFSYFTRVKKKRIIYACKMCLLLFVLNIFNRSYYIINICKMMALTLLHDIMYYKYNATYA